MVEYGPYFVFGLLLLALEIALLYVCMLGMKRICVKLGASKCNYLGTLDVVLERVWVAPL